jgi:hypothetical protein
MSQQRGGCVVAAAVDGVVSAVGLQSGQQVWQVKLEGQQIFADLLLQQLLLPPVEPYVAADLPQAAAAAATGIHGKHQEQPLQLAGVGAAGFSRSGGIGRREVVLVTTKAGQVLVLDVTTGHKVRGGAEAE